MARERPAEVDPAQEAEEQRRVAERRQRAADVADEEDEEHEDVGAVPTPVARWRAISGRISSMAMRRWCRAGSPDIVPSVEQGEVGQFGVPTRLPATRMPPATTNSVNSRRMNGR